MGHLATNHTISSTYLTPSTNKQPTSLLFLLNQPWVCFLELLIKVSDLWYLLSSLRYVQVDSEFGVAHSFDVWNLVAVSVKELELGIELHNPAQWHNGFATLVKRVPVELAS